MKRKLLTALLCGALMLTSLAGCGQGAENQSDANGASTGSENAVKDELVFVNYRDIRDLNPHLYAGEMYAQSILYDTLVSNTWPRTGRSVRTAGPIPSTSGME